MTATPLCRSLKAETILIFARPRFLHNSRFFQVISVLCRYIFVSLAFMRLAFALSTTSVRLLLSYRQQFPFSIFSRVSSSSFLFPFRFLSSFFRSFFIDFSSKKIPSPPLPSAHFFRDLQFFPSVPQRDRCGGK